VGQHVTANAGSGPNEKGGPKAAPGPVAGARSDRAGTEPHRGGVHRHALEDVFGGAILPLFALEDVRRGND